MQYSRVSSDSVLRDFVQYYGILKSTTVFCTVLLEVNWAELLLSGLLGAVDGEKQIVIERSY